THGVFYNIIGLTAGDTMQIVRGDGTVLNYRVVKTQLYPADNVDMQAAITPVTAGKSGLNLITCAGQVKKGTSEFSKRVIVFAEQM
ncbi:MAG TPA: class F sortase, partial [Candidatus Saccharimonadales bacterium]